MLEPRSPTVKEKGDSNKLKSAYEVDSNSDKLYFYQSFEDKQVFSFHWK